MKNTIVKKIIVIIIPLFAIFQACDFFLSISKGFDSIPSGIEAILIFIYVIYYFYEEFTSLNSLNIYKNYLFWIYTAILIYLAGTFFFYILATTMKGEIVAKYWFVNYIVETIKNILISFSIVIFIRSNHKKSLIKEKPYLDF